MGRNKQDRGIHLGIIPDGSRRWAKMREITSYNGSQSAEVMENIMSHVCEKYPEVSDLSIWGTLNREFEKTQRRQETHSRAAEMEDERPAL